MSACSPDKKLGRPQGGVDRDRRDGPPTIAFWSVAVKSGVLVQQAPGVEGRRREGPAEPLGGRNETSERLLRAGTAVEWPAYHRAMPLACPGEASGHVRIRTWPLNHSVALARP